MIIVSYNFLQIQQSSQNIKDVPGKHGTDVRCFTLRKEHLNLDGTSLVKIVCYVPN